MPFDSMSDLLEKVGLKKKADPFELTTFLRWLSKQPNDETYIYNNGRSCLLSRYFKAHLPNVDFVSQEAVHFNTGEVRDFPKAMDRVSRQAHPPLAWADHMTIGAAKTFAHSLGYLV